MSDELSPDDELEALLDEFEWSPGDEHDLPRRDHFLAAMRPAHGPYSPPVEALSTLGSPDTPGNDTPSVPQEFAAELVRMARDRDLFLADEESPTVYAGVHAVRALKQLELGELVPELIPLFDVDSEWFLDNDLPELMASAGPLAVPPLAAYLADSGRWSNGHYSAALALKQIAEQHPEQRAAAVAAFAAMLDQLDNYGETSITAAVDMLTELKAVEELPRIRRAFEQDKVDTMMRGGWLDILNDLGVTPEPDDPLVLESARQVEERNAAFAATVPDRRLLAEADSAPQSGGKRSSAQSKKAKNKRKQSTAMRKANKRKKKK